MVGGVLLKMAVGETCLKELFSEPECCTITARNEPPSTRTLGRTLPVKPFFARKAWADRKGPKGGQHERAGQFVVQLFELDFRSGTEGELDRAHDEEELDGAERTARRSKQDCGFWMSYVEKES